MTKILSFFSQNWVKNSQKNIIELSVYIFDNLDLFWKPNVCWSLLYHQHVTIISKTNFDRRTSGAIPCLALGAQIFPPFYF